MANFHFEQGSELGIPERYYNGIFELASEWITTSYKGLPELWSGKKEVTDEQFVEFRLLDVYFTAQRYLYEMEAHFCGLDVEDKLGKNKDWIELNRQATRNFVLVNEIFSLRKEVKVGLYQSNYIYIKMKNHGYSALQAMEETLNEAFESYYLSKAYGQRLKKLKIPAIDGCVDGLIAIIEGNLFWSSKCDRYNNFNDPKYNRYKF